VSAEAEFDETAVRPPVIARTAATAAIARANRFIVFSCCRGTDVPEIDRREE